VPAALLLVATALYAGSSGRSGSSSIRSSHRRLLRVDAVRLAAVLGAVAAAIWYAAQSR
jgi:hypothetical protein